MCVLYRIASPDCIQSLVGPKRKCHIFHRARHHHLHHYHLMAARHAHQTVWAAWQRSGRHNGIKRTRTENRARTEQVARTQTTMRVQPVFESTHAHNAKRYSLNGKVPSDVCVHVSSDCWACQNGMRTTIQARLRAQLSWRVAPVAEFERECFWYNKRVREHTHTHTYV